MDLNIKQRLIKLISDVDKGKYSNIALNEYFNENRLDRRERGGIIMTRGQGPKHGSFTYMSHGKHFYTPQRQHRYTAHTKSLSLSLKEIGRAHV